MPAAPRTRQSRQHPRVAVRKLTVQFRRRHLLDFLWTQSGHHKGLILDLSEGGIRALVEAAVPSGTPLAIRFEMPDVHGGIPLKGIVRRCRSVPGSGRFELGIHLAERPSDYVRAVGRLRKDPLLRQGVL